MPELIQPPEKIEVTKEDVARIIAKWWADYEANPEWFNDEPDASGENSADVFFRYAVELGIAK